MKTWYIIRMKVGDRYTYVATENDIEVHGWVDAYPIENFGFTSKEEAESTMAELQDYCSEQGYVNVKLFIEKIDDDQD